MSNRDLTWDEFYQKAEQLGLKLRNEPVAVSRATTAADLLNMKHSPRPYLMENVFRTGELVVLGGPRKTGKSLFLFDILIALVTAGKITERIWSNGACQVALVDAEFTPDDIASRLAKAAQLHGGIGDWTKSVHITSLKLEGRKLDLSNEADQQWIEERIGNSKVVAFDNYGQLIRPGGQRTTIWRQVTPWFARLLAQGITVILVHHENDDGDLKDSTKIEDDVDLVLSLRRPKEWEPTDGNIIEVHFPYARHLHGDQVCPFTIMYGEDASGFHRVLKPTGDGQAPSPKDKPPVVSKAEIEAHGLSELQIDMLSIARTKGVVRAGDVINEQVTGRGSSSVTTAFDKLRDKNLLVAHGTHKGRYYTPAGESKV